FLVRNDAWKHHVDSHIDIIQGYLANTDKCSIRIRVSGTRADLNIKSMTIDISRTEYEYPIPYDEAQTMLKQLCVQPLIRKTRYFVTVGRHTWEIDEFEGENAGLIIAELELEHPETDFDRPDWLGEEVSQDPRYFNICLVEHPYCDW
ncbi:MAG: CYTH domain-containing protein, partial [Gammaproteobacteria bacterium]